MSKFTVLCLSPYYVHFLSIKLIFFPNILNFSSAPFKVASMGQIELFEN